MKKASLLKAILGLFVFGLLIVIGSFAQAIITSDLAKTNEVGQIPKRSDASQVVPAGNSKSNGYIVELKEVPLAVKSVELNKQIQPIKDQVAQLKKASQSLAGSQKTTTLAQISSLEAVIKITELKIKTDLSSHKNKLVSEHLSALQSFGSSLTGFVASGSSSKVMREYTKVFNGFALNINEAEAEKIKSSSYVKSVSPDQQVQAMLMDSVPLIRANDVWALRDSAGQTITGKGIVIAIIDSGIDYTHPDLGGCFGPTCKVVGGYDFVNSDNNPMDDYGHGTHCASIAAGNGALKGVAPDTKLYAYKVLDAFGSGYFDGIIAGIERAIDPNQDGDFSDHVNVISMSLGADCQKYSSDCGPDDPMAKAVDNAVNSGIVAAIAAGNSGPNSSTINSPGVARKAITVGAINKDKTIAYFSSRGPVMGDAFGLIKPDVVAPGVSICAAQFDSWHSDRRCLDNKHISISGTSMATPHVAGAAALLLQAHPDWSPQEIKSVLRRTAVSINELINTQGYGLINVLRAVYSTKPPVAILNTSGKLGGEVKIMGTAKAENFKQYSLYYGTGVNPISWTLIGSSNQQVDSGTLWESFNIGDLADGNYTLKLIVTNMDGQSSGDMVVITVKNIEINPLGRIIEKNSIVNITGTIYVKNFLNYVIEYSAGQEESDWRTKGIVLANGGRQPVINGLLATWDTGLLDIPAYSLRITVNYTDSKTHTEYARVFADPRLKQGWPVYQEAGERLFYYPKVFDFNRDGKEEIVVVSTDDTSIYRNDGSLAGRWPIGYDGYSFVRYVGFDGAPAVGDINNDNENEIVIGGFSGIRLFSYPNKITTYPIGFALYVMLADLDHDKRLDIIFSQLIEDSQPGSYHQSLVALKYVDQHFEGIIGWPYNFPSYTRENGSYVHGLATGDVDGDGNLEVVVVFTNRYYNPRDNYDEILVFSSQGQIKNRFSLPKDEILDNGIFLADIDTDGIPEIGFSSNSPDYTEAKKVFLTFKKPDGRTVSGWPNEKTVGEISFRNIEAPIMSDINNDGKQEVISWRYSGDFVHGRTSGGSIFLLDQEAKSLNGWPVILPNDPGSTFAITGDVNGDLRLDIIIPTMADWMWSAEDRPKVIYFLDSDGKRVGYPIQLPEGVRTTAGVTLGDVDGDGKTELVAVADDAGSRSYVAVWDLNGTYEKNSTSWPMFGYDLANTNCYNCSQPARAGALTLSTASDSPNGQVVQKGSKQVIIAKANLTANGVENIEVQPATFSFCDPQYGGLCNLIRSKDITNFKLVRTDTGQVVGYSNLFNIFNLARLTVSASSTIPLALKADISSTITASSVEFYLAANPDSPISAKGLTSGLTIKPTGSARGSISFVAVPPPPPTTGFTDPILVLANFGPSQGWPSQNTTPRFYADVNADSKSDLVGFAADGVYVSLSTGGSSFGAPVRWTTKFGSSPTSGGWSDQNTYPRALADVNGDNRADIVGFATNGVFVSLSTGTSFGAMTKWLSNQYGALPTAGSWTSNSLYPRLAADVNGDSKADIIGFGKDAVYVSLSTGAAFSSSAKWLANQFGPAPTAGSWADQNTYPRALADVNGDGKADIIGFGKLGVFVSLSTGTSFSSSSKWTSSFGTDPASGSWSSYDLYPRTAADVNNDNQADIIGFGKDGVFVALSRGAGFEALSKWSSQFGVVPAAGSWTTNDLYPRTADHWGEIVGFSGQGVYLSYPIPAPRGVMALDQKPMMAGLSIESLERIVQNLKDQISILMVQTQLWTASLAPLGR